MENNLLILAAFIFLVVLAIIIYFFVIKKKNNKIDTTKDSKIEIKESIINSEIDIKQTIENNLEIIIDKEVEKNNPVPVTNSTTSEKVKEKPITKEKKQSKQATSGVKDTEKNQSKLNINISSKTEKVLLKKLESFEKSKDFLKKDVNLNNLSKQFDTNTKYLSEIIKSYKNKNFNQYLNELRINYLIDQLNNNEKVLNTKVSYLASDFGFNSHSSFSTLFTQYVGQSPSEYIKALKDAKKEKITE